MHSYCFAQNLDSGLVAYYPFNGNAKDISGNANDGIVHGATLTFDRCGNLNSAFKFYELSFIFVPNFISKNIETDNRLSITAWINVNEYSGDSLPFYFPIVCKGNNNVFKGWEFIIHSHDGEDTNPGLQFFNANGNDYYSEGCNPYPSLDSWYFIGITYDFSLSMIQFFINNKKICEKTYSKIIQKNLDDSLYIGYSPLGWTEYSHGIIDDIRIYNRALTEQELLMLYNMPAKRAIIRTTNAIANVGTENFHIPIKAKLNCQQMLAENLSFTATIKFNATTFNPTGVTKGKILHDTIDKDLFRNLTIQCDSSDGVKISDSDSILMEIVGTVLVGDTFTPIEITDFKWNNSNIEIDTIINGSLETKGCALKLMRVQYFDPSTFSILPNPANSNNIEIKFEGDEEGKHSLNVYNIQGIKFDSKDWFNAKNGKIDFKFNVSDYPNGVYYIVLRSPWNVITKQLMVIK